MTSPGSSGGKVEGLWGSMEDLSFVTGGLPMESALIIAERAAFLLAAALAALGCVAALWRPGRGGGTHGHVRPLVGFHLLHFHRDTAPLPLWHGALHLHPGGPGRRGCAMEHRRGKACIIFWLMCCGGMDLCRI